MSIKIIWLLFQNGEWTFDTLGPIQALGFNIDPVKVSRHMDVHVQMSACNTYTHTMLLISKLPQRDPLNITCYKCTPCTYFRRHVGNGRSWYIKTGDGYVDSTTNVRCKY